MADWNVGTSILTNFVDGDGEMHGINDVERKPLHAATGHEAESRCNFFSGHQG
ncbi:hypothetical protein FOXG_21622 [Fusarium oxysporum f. sp. lycopersici 4287]|uniref:Uncharacterized protein n=1 Tax=Fusarium oxysporum f. sp. lycopersici (strain 4287 / CBS 123668 / FGSC 9935 / NRRL 34936) TaxID=426428 RepID=A0A0J9VZG4_FUSO4|nr:hypothetical protein FOXG_21622 [Fusarium oxysporum f. sp. lycopersici 4287]KNB16329.1 hypothetical protein FOXG_21622 [Fusarium oxysporum f. sp. lycopersici 4287]